MPSYEVLAYYIFTSIENPREEVLKHHAFLKDKDIRCRVYISEQGINGQMSASLEDSLLYQNWLHKDPRFAGVVFKVHTYPEHVFPRTTVKYRKQLVALDEPVDLSLAGDHVSPQQWKEMIEEKDPHTVLIDVRNDYEWEIGHFEGSELPKLEQFREFPEYTRALKTQVDPKNTRVLMCCTGGIRCELYSALMKQEGFEKVYQLDGGIINYGLSEGGKHWKGKLFVFDDRLAVPISEEETEVISHCRHCQAPSDVYYNCANMDCNELFLSCKSCAEKFQGCCCEECVSAPRVRAFQNEERPKPFRKCCNGQ